MSNDRISDTRDDPRRIALECVVYAWLRMPEVLACWREHAQADPEARAAWVRVFGKESEEGQAGEDCRPERTEP